MVITLNDANKLQTERQRIWSVQVAAWWLVTTHRTAIVCCPNMPLMPAKLFTITCSRLKDHRLKSRISTRHQNKIMAKIFLFLMISNAQKSSKGGKRIEAVLPMNQLTHMLQPACG
jgi:hypothetical protein